MPKVFANHVGALAQTCGLTEVGFFRDYGASMYPKDIKNLKAPKGAGWFVAGFTDTLPVYKEAYEELKKKFPIVYQSPVRINTRTGREFFFCIFDAKKGA